MLADLVKAGFYVYVPEASKYNQYTGQLQIALMNIKAAASSKEELEAQLKDAWRSVASSAGTSGPKERPALGFLISVVKRPA
jgi:hypothetical protein